MEQMEKTTFEQVVVAQAMKILQLETEVGHYKDMVDTMKADIQDRIDNRQVSDKSFTNQCVLCEKAVLPWEAAFLVEDNLFHKNCYKNAAYFKEYDFKYKKFNDAKEAQEGKTT